MLTRTCVCFQITLNNGARFVTLKSAASLYNNTGIPITLRLEDTSGSTPRSVTLPTLGERTLPALICVCIGIDCHLSPGTGDLSALRVFANWPALRSRLPHRHGESTVDRECALL